MSKLVITRAKALALFVALGTTTADKWNNKRMAVKASKVDELVDDDTKLPKAEDATLTKLLDAIENGVEIEVVDDTPADPEAPKKKGGKPAPAPVEEDVEVTFESLKAQYDAGEITAKEFTAARKKLSKVKPATEEKPAKAPKAAKEPKAPKAAEVPKTPGVRETVTRPYLAGVILRETGLGAGVTDKMIADLDKRYAAAGGRTNPRESAFTLRNAWHTVRGYINDSE